MSRDYEQQILAKAFDANAGFWSALVTANSVLAAVGSTLAALVPTTPILVWVLLIVVCAASLLLLVLNLKTTRDHYVGIGKLLGGSETPSADDVPRSRRKHLTLRRRETVTIALLFVELGLIVAGLLWGRLCFR